MKMQLITIKPKKRGIDAGFTITRDLYDDCGLVDSAHCNVPAAEPLPQASDLHIGLNSFPFFYLSLSTRI